MRELPILTNCGVSSFSNSALFKLRKRRFSLRSEKFFPATNARCYSASHPGSTGCRKASAIRTQPAALSGLHRVPRRTSATVLSVLIGLWYCAWGTPPGGLDFSQKPFYRRGFRPLPRSNPGKILILRGLAYRPVSYTHLRAHETRHDLVCRLLLE